MTIPSAPETTYAWIFLSIASSFSTEPVSLKAIINAADWINHAIPTHEELKISLGWLAGQKLIAKDGEAYLLTADGVALYKEVSDKFRSMNKIWDLFAKKFANLDHTHEIDSLTEKDVKKAYALYISK